MSTSSAGALVSVIIPNYNYARYIALAIESVRAQDHPAIELVVVDDCSSDDSVPAIRRALALPHRFTRVEVIELPANLGKLGALNRAVSACRGKYCITLDSDDMLTSGYVSRCVAELEQARSADRRTAFVYSNCRLIGPDGRLLGQGKSTAFDPRLIERFSYIPEPALTLMEAMREVMPFDETIRRGTKHHKWKRIIGKGWRGRHIAEPLFAYRMHRDNLSGIGARVLDEVAGGDRSERILSGYWPLEAR